MKWLAFFKKKTPLKTLQPEDMGYLEQQAKILNGSLRGSINDKASFLNYNMILSNLMEIAQTFYEEGYSDSRRESTIKKLDKKT